ncbi:hypothetical protein C2845_PM13G10640 [Panicum miliaceum]|uniref:Ubiquitin-like protease family profile domain-containing protein n=1 Tax=Panicum miliaceum TaxID=4540 RepID=A0A3L6RIH4_PANMI|nr:hypothetical protein C2845_PM13G10640 [Panicum miliaceum]
MPEHRGRVHGVSSLKGWKEGYGKNNEGLWKKKKRTSMDPNRLKKEIMDEIFGKLRAAGIDVDIALDASIGKSSCDSKEVEQPLIAPAGKHSPPPLVDVACHPPTNAWVLVMCMQQGSGNECGFYVAYHMIWLTATFSKLKGEKVVIYAMVAKSWLCSRMQPEAKMVLQGSTIKGDGQQ